MPCLDKLPNFIRCRDFYFTVHGAGKWILKDGHVVQGKSIAFAGLVHGKDEKTGEIYFAGQLVEPCDHCGNKRIC